MSRRHVKKLLEAKLVQEDSEHSDYEYEPRCVKESSKSTYQGLILSSSSDEEADSGATALSEKERRAPNEKEEWANNESSNSDHGDATPGPQSGLETSGPSASVSKKSENKKKKKKQKSKKAQSSASTSALDEVEQSLSEVNAMLGEPAKQEIAEYIDEDYNEKARLFSIKQKHLNSSNELARLLGPETKDPSKKACRRPNLNRIYKCKIIQKDFKFQKLGLSMSVVHRDSKKICFVFDHSKEYQQFHMLLVAELQTRTSNLNAIDLSLKNMHVEGLIQASDVLFRIEDSRVASDIIEQTIAYMQYVAMPSFNLLDLRTRLEYKYPENRAFHIMLLKYIHLMSNRACHRTAMELAKILLNLDESDPLGVVFIIDVVALRAREYEWLLDTIAFLEQEKMLRYMFNIKFSRALAQFLTSYPDSAERETSDHYIQHALLSYPWFLRLILQYTKYADQSVLAFELYSDFACNTTPQCLKEVIGLYASFTAPQWRDPPVMEWLLQNATSLGKTYAEDKVLRQAARTCGEERIALFPCWPDNMHRHLIIIHPMANFLAETGIPSVRSNRGYNPVPPSNSVIRYDCTPAPIPFAEMASGGSLLSEFFVSLLPNYVVPGDARED